MRDESTKKRWHVASWPPLAWLETVIKLAALDRRLDSPQPALEPH